MKTQKVYAWAYNKNKKSMVGQIFRTRKEAMKYKQLYKNKGWTGGLVKLNAPKPLTETEKQDLKKASIMLRKIQGLI